MLSTRIASCLLVLTLACHSRGGGGAGDDDDGGGSGACSDFCGALSDGDNCESVDSATCRAECEQYLGEQGISRLSCAEPAAELASCLASTRIVCEAPGQAVAEARDTPAAEPPYVYVPSGTIRVEDFECATLAGDRQDCMDDGPMVDFSEERTFEAESPEMFHGNGEQTDTGWTCRDCWDHIVFGPYVRTHPGAYRATFRVAVECTDPDPSSYAFTVDVAADATSIAETYVACADVASQGTFQEYVLDFDYTGGALEFRVYDNTSPSLTVDSISVVER